VGFSSPSPFAFCATMATSKMFIHEVRIRELIRLLSNETDPGKRKELADELACLLKLEGKPPKKIFL